MKKNLAKFLAIVMVVSVLAFSGIPVFADFSATQTGYGSQSSSSNDVMTWSLSVTSTSASSSGSLLNDYLGNVYCYVAVTGNSTQSTVAQSNSKSLNGNGLSAAIAFTNVCRHITDTVDQKFSGYGHREGSTSQLSWELDVSSSHARSSGTIVSGYTGMIYCGITVNDIWYDSDVANANTLDVWGDGSYAEIWIR